MTPERWAAIGEVFDQVVSGDLSEREVRLDQACATDFELRQAVEQLLRQHDRALNSDFLAVTAPWIPKKNCGSSTQLVGQRIGDYVVKRQIGGGGMGDVYLALRVKPFKKYVAMKFIKPVLNTSDMLRRFKDEVQFHAALSEHPNIAGLLDAGSTALGQPFFVMEYVEGQHIHHYCNNLKLSLYGRVEIFRSVLAAVQYAHQHTIVHLDLKPGNILVTNQGVVKLVDFGIARLVRTELCNTEQPVLDGNGLTLAYASPEQVGRDPVITTASDVYSLGVVLYELLTGRKPYDVEDRTVSEAERILCEATPELPSSVIGHHAISPQDRKAGTTDTRNAEGANGNHRQHRLHRLLLSDLDKIVLRALKKERRERFHSVADFDEALRDWLDIRPVSIPPKPTLLTRFHFWYWRNPLIAALAAVVSLLVCMVAVVATVGYYATSNALDTAIAAMKQEDEFRQALLETSSFQIRKRAVEQVATDPQLRNLLDETIGETTTLTRELSSPSLESGARTKLKLHLQHHEMRKDLQGRLEELVNSQHLAEPVVNWFLLDSNGCLLARVPANPALIGDDFSWRTYYHGGSRDYTRQQHSDSAPGQPIATTHLSAALESRTTGQPLWAVSTPMISVDGAFMGIVGLRVEIGREATYSDLKDAELP